MITSILGKKIDLLIPFFCVIIICLFGYFLTAFNSYFWYDDFWIKYEINSKGFWNTAYWFYFNWDGRSISPVYIFRNLLIYLIPYQLFFIPALLALISIFITSNYVFLIIYNSLEIRIEGIKKVFFILLIMFGLWLGFSTHLSRSVYWLTGSFYTYSNMVLFMSIYYLLYKFNNVYLNVILIFFVASSGPNLGLIIVTLLSLIFVFKLFNFSKINF